MVIALHYPNQGRSRGCYMQQGTQEKAGMGQLERDGGLIYHSAVEGNNK